MLRKIIIFLGSLCLFGASSATAQTDFSKWDKRDLSQPAGTEMMSPVGGPLIRMHSYPIAELEKAGRQSLRSAGTSRQAQIEYALSILSLSMIWDETFDGRVLSGLVAASDGPYSFKAEFSPDQKSLTLALIATDDNGQVLNGAAASARRLSSTGTSASYKAKSPAPEITSQKKASAAISPRSKTYAPPETVAQMDRWVPSGKLSKSLNPKDPLSPRYYLAQTGPKYGVYDFKTAIAKLPTVSKLNLKGKPVVEVLEAWKQYDGSNAAIVMQHTRIGNQDGVIVLFMTQKKGQSGIIYFGYEVTEETYLQWGGITRMMKLRKVVPSVESFPAATRNRISRAPFKQQLNVYEAGLNKVLEKGAANMFAMSKAQSLMRMQELNYDLLLGGDITSPFIAD